MKMFSCGMIAVTPPKTVGMRQQKAGKESGIKKRDL